jgi:hypothetical protein
MASLFGDGSIWDTAASSMFFTESGVSKLLERARQGETIAVEDLLLEDTIIQDTQAQGEELIAL